VADAVGSRLQFLARRFQVLSITHLPQIAAHAGRHYRVLKALRGNRTITSVETLEWEARVEELGRMIGGARVTDGTMASAREMLETRTRADQARAARPTGESKSNAKGESERSRGERRK